MTSPVQIPPDEKIRKLLEQYPYLAQPLKKNIIEKLMDVFSTILKSPQRLI